jgi:hypothetical protein
MIEPGEDAKFPVEAGQGIVGIVKSHMERFQGHGPIFDEVGGPVNRAHSAATHHRLDKVPLSYRLTYHLSPSGTPPSS